MLLDFLLTSTPDETIKVCNTKKFMPNQFLSKLSLNFRKITEMLFCGEFGLEMADSK